MTQPEAHGWPVSPPLSRVARWRRMARTLRYLHPWQVAGRVVAAARARMPVRLPEPPADLRGRFAPRVELPQHDPWNAAEDLRAGRFCFLNEGADLGRPVQWGAPEKPLLWRFNLHYFHYLHLLPSEEQVALCREWIAAHPPTVQPAWHAYPTSLRIVNWCRADVQEADLQKSLYRQAAHLYRNLETHVMGNHLLENARALVYAGRFFDGQGEAPRWLAKGLEIFRRETPEQVLPDGGHFERSPMYHALMLEGFLDVLNLLPEDHPDEPFFRETCRKMTAAMQAFIHPDGSLALFNDSTQEIALAPADLLAYADALLGERPEPRFDLPDTGYHVFRDENWYFVCDAGPAGPDYLMAHAHADVFSFELSVDGVPFVVDTGVFAYAPGAARDFTRSTRAHSTVEIDGQSQIETWGSFRVGRRAAPSGVKENRTVGSLRVSGRFDGYARQPGERLTHQRTFELEVKAGTLRIEDEISGAGGHAIASRLTLHPEVSVQLEGDVAWLERDGIRLHVAGSHSLEIEEGWYCPRFGVSLPRPVLTLRYDGVLPGKLWFLVERDT